MKASSYEGVVSNGVIFVSYSSLDREIVNALVQEFLPDDKISEGIRTLNLSADDPSSRMRISVGKNLWKHIRENLGETVCFIAFLSDNYFKSNWCISELSVFHEINTNENKIRFIPLVIDLGSETWKDNPFTGKSKVLHASEAKQLQEFVAELGASNLFKCGADFPSEDACENFIKEKLHSLLNVREEREQGYSADLIQLHFSHEGTSNGPITQLVKRREYEQISVKMGKHARKKLLWTLFKSPLLVADAYRNPKRLTSYDCDFGEFKANRKRRVVIFEDATMAEAYFKRDLEYHLKCLKDIAGLPAEELTTELLESRATAFEGESRKNGGELLFTTIQRLPSCITGRKVQFCKNSFLEFAFSDFYAGSRSIEWLLETGFNSEFSARHKMTNQKNGHEFRHITFCALLESSCERAIRGCKLYKKLYGHLEDLREIAESVFERKKADCRIFVDKDHLHKLFE